MNEKMEAWVVEGTGELTMKEVSVPTLRPEQALVRVKATTIQRGQVRQLPNAARGSIPGLDVAGVVVEPSADGIGPPAGTRVIAMTGHSGGGWGQFAALPAGALGVIPDDLGWADAAALPTSGLTALHAIRHGGSLLGAKVLVVGATGAVGRFAAQFALYSGAEVTGTVSAEDRAASLSSLGLDEIVVTGRARGPFDLVVDTVGGDSLTHALEVVAAEGVVVTLGGGPGFDAPSSDAVVPLGWFARHHGARLEAENVGVRVIRQVGVARDLGFIAELASERRLDLNIEMEAGWRDAPALVDELSRGKTKGRIVLRVD